MKKISIAVLAVLVVLGFASPALAKKKKIEEGTWNLNITPDASAASRGEKASTDVLILSQGFLKLKSGGEHGYGTAPYTVRGNQFTAQIKSAYEGTIDWSGTWTDDTMAGRMVWTTREGSVLTYTFSGERDTGKKKKH